MKRKWKHLFIACCIAASTVLGGCYDVRPSDIEGSESPTDNPTALSDNAAGQSEYGIPDMETGVLRACVLAEGGREFFGSSFQTNRYFYELKTSDDPKDFDIYTLNVTDFITRRQEILCRREDCAHNSAACPVFIEGKAYILQAGKKLVLIRAEMEEGDQYDDETGTYETQSATPGSITVMDLDGSNPRVLLDSAIHLESSWLTDDFYLYGIRITPAPEGGHVDYDKKRHLFRMSLETGEAEDLLEIPVGTCFPIGVLEGKILMREMQYPLPGHGLETAQWEENLKAGRYTFVTVDPVNGHMETLEKDLSSWNTDGSYMGDGTFYFNKRHSPEVYYHTPNLYRLDLRTFEESIVIEGEENHEYYASAIHDGRMLYTDVQFHPAADGNMERVKEDTLWMDLETGETQPLTLFYEAAFTLDGDTETYRETVIPLADAGDYYLVNSDVVRVNTTVRSAIFVYQRSLILKSDYFAGNANYIPITVI